MPGQIGHFRFPGDGETAAGLDAATDNFPRDDRGGDLPGRIPNGANVETGKRRSFKTPTRVGALVGAFCVALLGLLSLAPYWARTQVRRSIEATCSGVRGTPYYSACIAQARGRQARAAHLHWNAWGSWFSWPAIVLFLIVAAVVGFKAVFSKSEKVVLSRQIRLALYLADLLFLVSVFHIPHDNAGRSWGLWLSLVCVIAINVGVLLATTHVGEWTAEHWPKRAKPAAAVEPTQQPRAPQQTDYRPTPQATPPGQRQPSWPPPIGQQPFPQPGQQPHPPTGQRQFPPNGQR